MSVRMVKREDGLGIEGNGLVVMRVSPEGFALMNTAVQRCANLTTTADGFTERRNGDSGATNSFAACNLLCCPAIPIGEHKNIGSLNSRLAENKG